MKRQFLFVIGIFRAIFLYLYRLLHCKIKFISYKYGYYCTKIKWGYFYKIYVRFVCRGSLCKMCYYFVILFFGDLGENRRNTLCDYSLLIFRSVYSSIKRFTRFNPSLIQKDYRGAQLYTVTHVILFLSYTRFNND